MFSRVLFFLCCVIISLSPTLVSADSNHYSTQEEKAVFAFFKRAGAMPEFKRWAKTFDYRAYFNYEDAERGEIRRFYDKQAERLLWGFGAYHPDKELLRLRTGVMLMREAKGGQYYLRYALKGFGQKDLLYFPYPYIDEVVGLVVEDLKPYGRMRISETDYKDLDAVFAGQKMIEASLNMRVKALEADMKNSLIIDDRIVWLLHGGIADFSYEVKRGADYERIYFQEMPWYIKEREKDILDILDE